MKNAHLAMCMNRFSYIIAYYVIDVNVIALETA